jgi:hypothetical protein
LGGPQNPGLQSETVFEKISFFFLISEENSEEMYEDIYKTKSNHPKVE